MTKLTIESAAVIAFKALVKKRISKYWDEMKLTAPKPQVRLCGGSKFIRVETHREGGHNGSIHSFIAACDSSTKSLGDIVTGDILKPATFSKPARGARGNVSSEQLGEEAFGDGYLIRYAKQEGVK